MERESRNKTEFARGAVLVAGMLASIAGAIPRPADAATPFRVVSYNVWGLPGVLLQKPSRIPLIPREASRLDADVIAFEETFHSATRRLMSIPGYPYVALGPSKGDGRTSSGLMVVSKWPIVHQERIRFSDCSGTDCFANKGALLVRLAVEGAGEVDFVATHLNAAGKDELRSRQLAEILELVERNSGDRPVILAGDFNFHSESDPWYDLTMDWGFRDSFAEFRETHSQLGPVDWFGFSYDPDRNSNLRLEAPFKRGDRLDYIWVKDRGATRTRVRRSGLVFDKLVSGMHLSDHFGVRTDFVIEPASAAAAQN